MQAVSRQCLFIELFLGAKSILLHAAPGGIKQKWLSGCIVLKIDPEATLANGDSLKTAMEQIKKDLATQK